MHRYEPSWRARAKKEEDAKAAAATAAAAAAAAGTPTATAASDFGNMAGLGDGSGGGDGGVGMQEGSVQARTGGTARAALTAAQREAEEAAKAKTSRISRKRRRIEQATKDREEQRAIKEWVGKLPGADLSAFHPLRRDFQPERDGRAPELVRRACGWLTFLACCASRSAAPHRATQRGVTKRGVA